MNDLVKLKDGAAVVSSKDVADKFGKTHRDVTRAISLMECSQEFRDANFARSSYLSPQNKKFDCFDITRDGFSFLCMGFTGKNAAKWKEGYISAFNLMESSLQESGTLMQQINKAILILEEDKAIASSCAKGLSNWKRLKNEHTEEIDRLVSCAQLSLGFEPLK